LASNDLKEDAMTEGSHVVDEYGPEGGGEGGSTKAQAKEKARGAKQQVSGQVQEKTQQVAGQVQEKTQQVKGQAGSRLRDEADRRSTQAGEQVVPMADALRSTGEQLRSQGKEPHAKVADGVADRVERLGTYLTESDGDSLLRDVENFGRQRPWILGLGGAAIGFFASRFLKASSSRRYQAEFPQRSWTATSRPGMEPLDVPPPAPIPDAAAPIPDADFPPATPAPASRPPQAY
jgi:hypothetical protein